MALIKKIVLFIITLFFISILLIGATNGFAKEPVGIGVGTRTCSEFINETLEIKANIWGDEGFKYIGVFNNTEGYVPSILLRLGADKQLFMNLKVVVKNGDEKNEKEYVTFVTIPKRYQVEPKTNINKLKDKN